MNYPLISIIMPCFNAENNLKRSVNSILDQTYPNWELIAIDDGSKDNTLQWLQGQSDSRIKVISQSNHGVSAARNTGLTQATGSYVAFLDSDDSWHNNFLKLMTQTLEDNLTLGLAYCGWQNVGLSDKSNAPFIPPNYENSEKIITLLENNRWPIHAALTRLSLVKEIGGFDSRITVGEDFLLWLEIACFHKIQLVPHVLAYYQHHDGVQASRDRGRAAIQILSVQQLFLKRHPGIRDKLGKKRVQTMILRAFINKGYDAYWKRNLKTAQMIFRATIFKGGWIMRDLKYLIPALLPIKYYKLFIKFFGKS